MADAQPAVLPQMGTAARGEVVSIAIGPEKKVFRIHKDILCYHSEYFRTAYSGRWKDATEGVALDDVEVEVFNLFVHWLYAQDLPGEDDELLRIAELDKVNRNDLQYMEADMLRIKACVFGDRFSVRSFYEEHHNAYVNENAHMPPLYEAVIYAFANLPKDAPLLKHMVDRQCIDWLGTDYGKQKDHLSLLPYDFLLQFMLRSKELVVDSEDRKSSSTCSYHVHGSNKARRTCLKYA
ncbi:Nn.00g061820.m01.CDS01 [Neocucurbitaria sp. VM-36]